MAFQSKITSKGQVTVPVEIRRKLGLRRGDRVEFREEGPDTVIARATDAKSPFDKYLGALRSKRKHQMTSKDWMAELRDEVEPKR